MIFFKAIFHFLFPIFWGFRSVYSQTIEVYDGGTIEGNFSSLEEALTTNINFERTFLISCLNSCDIFNEKNLSNRSTIIGKHTQQIILLHSTIVIENFLNLTNIVISSKLNSSVLVWNILENGTFICIQCDFTNFEGNQPFIIFESYKAIFLCDRCNFSEIISSNLTIIFNATLSRITVIDTLFQLSEVSFFSGYNCALSITQTFFHNITIGKLNMATDSFIKLINSDLNFTNNSLTSCNFYSEYFLNIQYDFNLGAQIPLATINKCIFYNILTTIQAFIFISGVNVLNFNAENLFFLDLTLYGPLFFLKNVNETIFDNFEIFGVTSNQFLHISDSNYVQFHNVSFYSTDIFPGESVILFENTIQKIINNLTLVNSKNFVTTPGIKIIGTTKNKNSKTNKIPK